MIRPRGEIPSPEVELDRTVVRQCEVDDFVAAASPDDSAPATSSRQVPLTFALVLRRRHGPEIELAPDAFAIHGGHDIELHRPIRVGGEYRTRARVEDVFEKTGRSGPLTIVCRHVRILDADDVTAVEIRDRQIVRWRPGGSRSSSAEPRPGGTHGPESGGTPAAEPLPPPIETRSLEIGDAIGPLSRPGPGPEQISAWANALHDRETLFHDHAGARELGYRDLVVPGPMQSAFIDDMLRRLLPAWQMRRLSMTFRQSLIAGDPIAIEGVVTDALDDAHDRQRTCDVVVSNRASGETTSIGTVLLVRS